MASVRARNNNQKLFFDFQYMGRRCREYTQLSDTPANRKQLQRVLDKMEAEMTLGTFEYATYFPSSPRVEQFEQHKDRIRSRISKGPTFKDFSETWFGEMEIQWRKTHKLGVQDILDQYLLIGLVKRVLAASPKQIFSHFGLLLPKFRTEVESLCQHQESTIS